VATVHQFGTERNADHDRVNAQPGIRTNRRHGLRVFGPGPRQNPRRACDRALSTGQAGSPANGYNSPQLCTLGQPLMPLTRLRMNWAPMS
jgi:hypothetical protein